MKKYNINGVLYPSREEARREADRLVRFCQEFGVKNLFSPPIDVLGDGLKRRLSGEIRIEDLLGREEIKVNTREIEAYFAGKVVMVTGAAGSIGSELCRQLAAFLVWGIWCYLIMRKPRCTSCAWNWNGISRT